VVGGRLPAIDSFRAFHGRKSPVDVLLRQNGTIATM
jgi:hypothetical protein